MGSTTIAAAVLTMAFLAGCTMRTQAPTSASAYDFSERDAYGQSFATSPTYAGQDTSWTTTAPARSVVGAWEEKAPTDVAPVKAKGAEEGAGAKFDDASPEQKGTQAQAPTPARPAPRPATTPPQGAQSPSQVGVGASGR
jgi:hypothetical protein